MMKNSVQKSVISSPRAPSVNDEWKLRLAAARYGMQQQKNVLTALIRLVQQLFTTILCTDTKATSNGKDIISDTTDTPLSRLASLEGSVRSFSLA